MTDLFKKSFNIVKDTPFITLYFVIYLIILFLILPVILTNNNQIITSILGILVLLLTCAFLAGWFGMIKTSLRLYKDEKRTPEQKVEELVQLKNSFFASVSTHILPVIAGFIMMIVVLYGLSYLSDMLFGKVDDVINNLAKYANDTEGLKTYFLSLPDSTWAVIFKKSVFSYISYSLTILCALFFAASLFLNEKCSLNPLRAVANSIVTIFNKFFECLLIFTLIILLNFLLVFLQALFIQNVVISFITMILRVYFAAYMIVLIFDLYEKNTKKICNCSNNRSDSIGQNEDCNKPGEEN